MRSNAARVRSESLLEWLLFALRIESESPSQSIIIIDSGKLMLTKAKKAA